MRADTWHRLAACGLALSGLGLACGRAGEAPRHVFTCPSADRVTHLADVHYDGVACRDAVASAEATLTAGYYRKACEQLAPRAGLPARVSDAFVSRCEAAPGPGGGSILQIDLCCP